MTQDNIHAGAQTLPSTHLALEQMSPRAIVLELYRLLSQEAERPLDFLDFAQGLCKLFGQERTSKVYDLIVEAWQAEGLRPAQYEEVRALLFDRYRIFQADQPKQVEVAQASSEIAPAKVSEAVETPTKPSDSTPIQEVAPDEETSPVEAQAKDPAPSVEPLASEAEAPDVSMPSSEPSIAVEPVQIAPAVEVVVDKSKAQILEATKRSFSGGSYETRLPEPEISHLLPRGKNKIVDWAYFGEGKSQWQVYYEPLKQMAPRVRGQVSKRLQDVTALRIYIANVFKVLQFNLYQQHIYIAINTDESYATFDTGLTDASGESIYALFERNNIIVNPINWMFRSFCTLSSKDGSILQERFYTLPELHPHFTEPTPPPFAPLGDIKGYKHSNEGLVKAIGLFPVSALLELREMLVNFDISDLEQIDETRGFGNMKDYQMKEKRKQISIAINDSDEAQAIVIEDYLLPAVKDSLGLVEAYPELAIPYPIHFDGGNHKTYLIPLLSSEAADIESDQALIADLANYVDMIAQVRINDDGSRIVTHIDSIDNIYNLTHLREPNDIAWLKKSLAELSKRNQRVPRTPDF